MDGGSGSSLLIVKFHSIFSGENRTIVGQQLDCRNRTLTVHLTVRSPLLARDPFLLAQADLSTAGQVPASGRFLHQRRPMGPHRF